MGYAARRFTTLLDLRGWACFLGLGLVLVLGIPLLNAAVSPQSAFHLGDYLIPLFGKYLCYAILALSGYAFGMYLMRSIGTLGVYKNALLPDFMVFLNWKALPWYWYGFDHFAFAVAMTFLVPGLLAFAFGWFAFRSRVTGVYLSIITQAMTFALQLAFFRNDMGFGGNNGLTDFKTLLGFDLHAPATRIGLYLATVVALAFSFLICRFIVTSKLGRVLRAIRDAEPRVRFLGYSVTNAKLFVFTLSAMLAGLAGALYVPQVGIINPSEFSPAASIEIAVWVAVGGRGTLAGAALGAVLVNLAKTYFTDAAPEVWLFFLGALFILVTLIFPRGIAGLARQWRDWWESRQAVLARGGDD
jgi:urea transport system permease protein